MLARLLSPEQFGIVGMVYVFTGFAGLFSDLGLGAALVQRADIDESHYDSAFWLNVVTGAALTGALVWAAPLVAEFYHEPSLAPITRVVALQFIVGALNVVPYAQLSRRMEFRTLTLVETGTAVFGGVVGIVLALWGAGVWSLVAQSLATVTASVGCMWTLSGWRPGLRARRRKVADLLRFSSGLLGFNVLNYWTRNLDNALIGRTVGSVALGIYSRAYSLMLLPLTQISGVVGRVMFPALSAIQADAARVKSVYLRAISAVALITFPMMLGLLVIADHFVLFLLGPKWIGVIPVLRLFALLGMVQSIVTTGGWIYQSQGRTGLMFKWGVASAVMVLSGFVVGIRWGMMGVVIGYVIVSGLIMPYPALAIPARLIGIRFGEIARAVAPTLACSLAMAVAVWGADTLLVARFSHGLAFALDTTLGIAVYALLVHAGGVGSYRDVRQVLAQRLGGPPSHTPKQNALLGA